MTDYRSSPPEAESCLCQPYLSSQKGGTLIAEDVHDLATHEQRMRAPDLYRPEKCPRCGARLHLHDLRPRLLLADPAIATEVIRFRCGDRNACDATWQVLPAFLARHLWRSWQVVQTAIETPGRSPVPKRTAQRWRGRLLSGARLLVSVLATAGSEVWTAIATAAGLPCNRFDFIREYGAAMMPVGGECFAELAALIHRLSPGVRLM